MPGRKVRSAILYTAVSQKKVGALAGAERFLAEYRAFGANDFSDTLHSFPSGASSGYAGTVCRCSSGL